MKPPIFFKIDIHNAPDVLYKMVYSLWEENVGGWYEYSTSSIIHCIKFDSPKFDSLKFDSPTLVAMILHRGSRIPWFSNFSTNDSPIPQFRHQWFALSVNDSPIPQFMACKDWARLTIYRFRLAFCPNLVPVTWALICLPNPTKSRLQLDFVS